MELKERIAGWMAGREDEFVGALAPLIAIDSTTGEAKPGMPFGEGPAKALAAALKLAESWGLTTGGDEGYVGLADLNDKEDRLHILVHLDVVGAGDHWDTDPFTLVRDGDLIYGRGTDDDKGPAVAAMLAMRCVKELGLPLTGNVKLVLGTDEETGSRDIAHYYAAHPFAPNSMTPDSEFPVTNVEKARYAPRISAAWGKQPIGGKRLAKLQGGIRVNVAPANCEAVVEGMTAAEADMAAKAAEEISGVKFELADTAAGLVITATGRQSHAAYPDGGKNAITAMLALLCALPLEEDEAHAAVKKLHALFPYGDNRGTALGIAQKDNVSGELTLTLSLLELSGTGFRAQFDSRDPISATEESVKVPVEEKIAALGWRCEGGFTPGHYVPEDSDFIRTLIRSYEEFSGKKGCCESTGGGTYVHHIPGGVAFGAGDHGFDSRLHGANERASIRQLLMTAEVYAAVIARLCE